MPWVTIRPSRPRRGRIQKGYASCILFTDRVVVVEAYLKRTYTLKAWLVVAFASITAVPLLSAAYFGIREYDRALRVEGTRAVETGMRVAVDSLGDIRSSTLADAVRLTGDHGIRTSQGTALREELTERATRFDQTAIAVVDGEGRFIAASAGSAHVAEWPLLTEGLRSRNATAFFGVVPERELVRLGLAAALAVTPVDALGGTVVPGEEKGALGCVALAPLDDGRWVFVFSTLKKDHRFVDSIADKVGGTAAVFQAGTRVSTNIKDGDGTRSLGVPVADEVRETTLASGEGFRGEVEVLGESYLGAYEPLRDPTGMVVGMLHVGLPLAPYTDAITRYALFATAFLVVAFGVSIVAAFAVGRGMTKPLAGVADAASRAAGGDLTVTVPETGYREARVTGGAFNAMIEGLRSLLGQTQASAHRLGGVSGDIGDSARVASDSASRQASSIAEITATISQLSRTFSSVAGSAERVLHVAENALEVAQSGRESVETGDRAMDELAAGASDSAEAAQAMDEVAASITEMTTIISGIAEQTKILALNAAIEAARAGDAGHGFAVVATEIRTLAESVRQSAGRINGLVAGIQSASSDLTRTARHQAELAQAGVERSRASRDSFDRIVDQMEGTAHAAREIATAATEQKVAAEQLAVVMQDVTSSADETARVARDLVGSADSVREEADELRRTLGGFRV